MKTFAPPCGILAIHFLVFNCLFFSPIKAQTIQIDSTFTSDGEIFPFSPNDTIYGLSISGSVVLHSDTSLVRVILTDIYGQEWMVYEAYPMIVTDTAFEFEEECDETCFLEEFIPNSISIQIIDGLIDISQFAFHSMPFENLIGLQYQAKINNDFQKMQFINQYIATRNWGWIADTNDLSNKYYFEKKLLFKEKYHLLGRDFYSGGTFYSVLHENLPLYSDRSLIASFDWREKHYAHLITSPYYLDDGEEHSNGWLTGLRSQLTCTSCSAFAGIASLEAAINLYSNYQFDLIENVRFSEKDAFNCSNNMGGNEGCDCKVGKEIIKILNKFRDDGVVNESCYRYIQPYCEFTEGTCAENSSKCPLPDWTAQICDRDIYDLDDFSTPTERANYLKKLIMDYGPLTIQLYFFHTLDPDVSHAVSLVGFDFNETTGKIDWICKDSYGSGWGEFGYDYEPFFLGTGAYFGEPYIDRYVHSFVYNSDDCPIPISVLCHFNPQFELTVHKNDFDKDGYYNWGIGPIPEGWEPPCHSENISEDWNDNNERIGPCDDNYFEIPVKPEMEVSYVNLIGITVRNNDIIYVTGNSLSENYYDFIVSNLGNAQLNFQKVSLPTPPHAYIEIDFQNHPGWFEYNGMDYLDTAICMNSHETFQIKLNSYAVAGDLAHIRIHLNEFDMEDFEFTLIFNSCETQSGYEPIYGKTFWDQEYRTQLKDVHVMTDATLTISGEVILSPEADIIVQPGGKLIIDGGKLTSSCSSFWNGIDVWGDPRQPQIMHAQGMVEIKSGGMIEYADTAISTAQFINISYYSSGGIVSCKDAIFKDNTNDVVFHPYNNTNPYTHQIIANASRFTRTRFETTNDYYDITHSATGAHLKLNEVGGIRFAGCTFNNSSTQKDYSRGIGIESNAAGYTINNFCTEDIIPCPGEQPCSFENLDYGVRAFNTNSYFAITIDSADFIDNDRGIYMSIVNDASIFKNHFYLNADDDYFEHGDILVGLYTERCTRYQIEENKITGLDHSNFTLIGMHLLNSLPEYNEIYNDSLVNLTIGITAAGENRNEKEHTVGLCIKCNDFIDCISDIYVSPEGGEYKDRFGIATTQGLPGSSAPPGVDPNAMGAGNTFSEKDPNSQDYNFNNDGDLDLINYTHQPNTEVDKLSPFPYNNIGLSEDGLVSYSKDASCPSHLNPGGIQLELEKSSLSIEKEISTLYIDTLTQYVDGGDTQGLTFDVQTSFPDDALDLKQQLLDESPYLSDTVMKSAIEKENVLVNAMVRDILVVNPQAAKSAEIVAALETKFDPLPDYMMAEILEGKSILGEKENLERKMALHDALKSNALANIIRYYKNDSLLTSSKDSVSAYLEFNNTPETQYQLAFCKLSSGDSTIVLDLLNDLPLDYFLTSQQLNTHELYEELFNTLIVMHSDSVKIDSTSTSELFSLMNTTNELPGIFARNILIINNLVSYSEPVYLPNNLKNTVVNEKKHFIGLNKSSNLKIYPNPTKSYVIIEYYLDNISKSATITILDANGKILYSHDIQDTQNQYIIDTRKYPPGIYVVSLISDDKTIAFQKFIIIQ